MDLSEIPYALTGTALEVSYKASHEKRKPIAKGFLYEQTINMIAADPGTGKSTIATQAAIELAAGMPVFGMFEVPKPVKVLYIQTERSIIELLERIETVSHTLPIVTSNLCITAEYQRFNLIKPDQAEMFINCVLRDCPLVEVIIIDPIYSIVAGGLKDDGPASAFTKTMTLLQKHTDAVLWYNHHTVKTQYTYKGDAIQRTDPFYGSQWLKAHVTGSYHLRECKGGVELICKKDNYGVLQKQITLEYNPENELCHVPLEGMSPEQRLGVFINNRKTLKKPFTFEDLKNEIKLSTRVCRELLVHTWFLDTFTYTTHSHGTRYYNFKE